MDADAPVQVGAPVAAIISGHQSAPSISERLEARFGLGDNPPRRRALYSRLQALVRMHGDAVETLIKEAASQAVGARRPGHYFAKAVVLKLREAQVYTWQN